MSTDKNQSAIQEARDQLFLDTADGNRLNVVTSNLGLDRPVSGFSDDDEWRAAAKIIALQSKVVRNIFHRVIEVCIGPQTSRIGVTGVANLVGDQFLQLDDASDLLQLGTLTIDPGLATEETLDFCFRDLRTNRVFFTSAMQFTHVPLFSASGFLRSDIVATATTLPLIDSSTFPTAGFPYSVVLDRGEEGEEIVQVSGNNTTLNELTCNATANGHTAATVTFLRRALAEATIVGRVFIVLGANQTRDFPSIGFVRINFGGGTEEIREYTSNQPADNVLILKRPLANAHAVDESVELMNPGAAVETLSVIQNSVDWSVFETEPNKVKIFIPENFTLTRIIDASFLHGAVDVGGAGSDAVNGAVSAGALLLPLVSVLDFPSAGIINIDAGTETTFYTRRLSGNAIEKSNTETFTLVDGQTLLVSVAGAVAVAATFNIADFVDITAAQAFEVALVITTDITGATGYARGGVVEIHSNIGGTIEVTGGTANPALGFDTPTLVLAKALVNSFGGGESVVEVQVPYGGTDLEEGNLRDGSGDLQPNQFPGPYIYDVTQRGTSDRSSTLSTLIPPPTRVAFDSIVGQTNLEVKDVGLLPSPPQTVRIGRTTGFQEDKNLLDVTPFAGLSTTVNANVGAGVASLDGADTTGFPESDGVNQAGYRIIIDRGGANEEILRVNQNTAGTPGTFSFTILTSNLHNLGETIELLNDVLTFDLLTQTHAGSDEAFAIQGHLVELVVSQLDVVDGTQFPTTAGWVWLNFGKEILNQRKRITTVVSPTILELSSTDDFPTSGFPYRVVVSEGRPEEEFGLVIANDTGLDRLTFAPALANTHLVDSYIRFVSGGPVAIQFTSRIGNVLSLNARVFESGHVVGERVMFSPLESRPGIDGFDYAFLLPPDPGGCLVVLLDLVRAAGIEVVFLTVGSSEEE